MRVGLPARALRARVRATTVINAAVILCYQCHGFLSFVAPYFTLLA